MIVRETTWSNSKGQVVQVSMYVLADWWEDLYGVTRNVGPFDCLEDVLADVRADCLAWYRLHGEQPSLFDAAPTP